MMNSIFLIICLLFVTECSDAGEQPGTSSDDLSNLPTISHGNLRFPYIRYAKTDGRGSSRGRAIFIYPIKAHRNEILDLEYSPGTDVRGLFGEELFGESGAVTAQEGLLVVSTMPVSLPLQIDRASQWNMRYAKRIFVCVTSLQEAALPRRLFRIQCSSKDYDLSFLYSESLGVVQFQDFCDSSICTYRLLDEQGLLSAGMLKLMGLVPKQKGGRTAQ